MLDLEVWYDLQLPITGGIVEEYTGINLEEVIEWIGKNKALIWVFRMNRLSSKCDVCGGTREFLGGSGYGSAF